MEKQYNRVMLGRGGQFAEDCHKGGYIGADFDIPEDLSANLFDDWRKFNERYIPLYLQYNPDKPSKVAAGLSCGFLWTICCGLKEGDIVLCPKGNGEYMVGEISGKYYYAPDTTLPHRRPVKWYNQVIRRADMSAKLRNSSGSIGTCCNITKYADEIEDLLSKKSKASTKPIAAVATPQTKYHERDLHQVFCTYLRDKEDVFAKTIYHEKSSSSDKAQKWIHPDIIGVRHSSLLTEETKTLQKAIDAYKAICLYSFELKREINTDYELKEYYFQAVSNSSWANKGYLVAYEINEELKPEIERLVSAFGIGVIRLQAHKDDTQILYEAEEKEIDYTTLDKLCNNNPDVREFIDKLNSLITAPKKYLTGAESEFASICDKVFQDDQELEKYCQEKNIPY